MFPQRIEPYTIRTNTRLNGHSEVKSNSSTTLSGLAEDSAKASLGRISISQNSDPVKETKSFGRLSVSQNPDIQREPKSQACMLYPSFKLLKLTWCPSLI